MAVFFLFVLATTVGSLSTLFWIPEDDLGRGYFQMNALVVLGLLGLAAAATALHPMAPYGELSGPGVAAQVAALAGAFVYYGAVWRERWRAARWAAAFSLLTGTAALAIAADHLVPAAPARPHSRLLLGACLVTSSLLLGWSLVTMLLGHWYLVAPRLSFRHLVVFCQVLLWLVVARAVSVGGSVAAAGLAPAEAEPAVWSLLVGFAGQGMFFWVRLLWGLAIPLALAAMSLHCARRRSNQSATGILYVLVVGSFIGELTAFFLAVTTGVPI